MDSVSEKERSRKTRYDKDKNRDRDREHKHRTKDHHHRSSKQTDEDSHRRHHHRDDKRDHVSRGYSEEREGSRERERERDSKRERSYEREGSGERVSREVSVERRHSSSHSHKRKEREVSEDRSDGGEKRVRVSEERRERRRFEDKVEEDDAKYVNEGVSKEERRERRKFEDGEGKDSDGKQESKARRKFEDRVEEDGHVPTSNGSGSAQTSANAEPLNMASDGVPQTSLAVGHPAPPKVSSITTTNENKGVSITRSHEVPGKSSTDGSTSAAGKSGSLSLDALAKAKKALQMQKELAEKLKKIPLLNKGTSTSSDSSSSVGPKEGRKVPSLGTGKLPLPVSSTASRLAKPSATALPASAATSMEPSVDGIAGLAGLTNIPNIEAVKRAQELAAKMGFHQDPEFAPLINMFPGQLTTDLAIQQKPSKAPVLRLDALGREVDEHGNVINVPKINNLSTLKVNINKQKKDAFQILKPELEVDPESNPHFDSRMGINKDKLLRPKRMSFQFVEEGKWSRDAEIIKLKSQFGELQAKELKAKQAQLAKAKAEPDINPNLIELSERVVIKEKPKELIPDVEWWDKPFLHSGDYGDIIDGMMSEDKLKMEKITIYVEHPLPIEPPAEPAPPPPQPLKLTKKEQKKLRTQRRLAREKDRQEMIRQGLIEPPKPKVKMSNLMKVLGSEATQDPTRLEMEIRTAAAEREQAHVDRNIARKLTPAERREKKERKLFDDPNTLETIVSVYKINDLSHPQTRFKVDVNAQENRLTGCAVISDGMSVVVVEGGTKAIKRYGKLMLRRINWAAAVENEDEEGEENEDKPMNKCSLVWQGSVAKASFNRFSVHQCRTEAAARKVFADAGVVHYWDLSVNFTDDQV
ncbi:Pre-mRNA-splicing factor 3 [Dillenia turbinata]|uniref:Pre-mRNA-splicing factor 3 n=1 Tax=Dillenia turbinata TaxID=194707 RepID=A0AAN8V9E5_9MAGN